MRRIRRPRPYSRARIPRARDRAASERRATLDALDLGRARRRERAPHRARDRDGPTRGRGTRDDARAPRDRDRAGRARTIARDCLPTQKRPRSVEVNPQSARGVRMPGANGASDGAGAKHAWRTWQSDDDIPQRKILIQHMCVAKAIESARRRGGTRGSRGRGLGREDARERALGRRDD